MTNLTTTETTMLLAFITEGRETTGAANAEEMIGDNMTWMSGADLMKTLGWTRQKVGGTMASLETKGLIVDSDESARGASGNDWYASDEGIEAGWAAINVS